MPNSDYQPVREHGAWVAFWAPFVLKSAFQPIFAMQDGRISPVAFEALLRPFRDGEAVAPLAFFGDLDGSDRILIENLTHRLHLQNAVEFVPAGAEIFVNLDPSVFVDHAVAEEAIHQMRLALADSGTDPHRIVCEVTEKRAVSQDVLFSIAAQLRASGFRIAVDDYGAADSDMGRIRDLHPNIVKFDADMIARMIHDAAGLALLTTMVEAFEGQGIRTVFEGIEHTGQIELARQSGVSMMQGFALARPEIVPASFPSLEAPHASTGAAESPAAGARRPHHQKSFGRRTSSA